jgi:hypothetical protein
MQETNRQVYSHTFGAQAVEGKRNVFDNNKA